MTGEHSVATSTQRAGRREWIGLAVLALPCLVYAMDLTVLHLAVPQLSAQLNPSSAQLLWIIDIYGFLVAGSLITMGTLGDRIGRRRLLLTGAAAFTVASVLAAFSTTAEMLIVTRALLGLAGATVAPSTLSLIRTMFHHPDQRTFAIGVWVTSFSVGSAVGPLVGGLLLEFFWWGSAFLIGVPVMILLLATGRSLLPEYRDPVAGRLDVPSAALSLGAVLLVILGVKLIAQYGVGVVPVLSVAGGLLLGGLFVSRQLRLDDPLIDLRLFQLPALSASLALYGLAVLNMLGGFLFLPQYLQLVLGLSPFDAGLWMLPWTVGFVVASLSMPALVRRMPPSQIIPVGLLVAAVGFASFTVVGHSISFWAFAIGSTMFSFGLGPVFTLTTDLVVGAAPPERAGAASALSETCAEFGGALGIAIFGSIGVAIYRSMLEPSLDPALTTAAAESARATLAGAVDAAATLQPAAQAALVGAAQDAFIQGLRFCAGVSAVGSLLLAILAKTTLRAPRQSIVQSASVV